MEIPSSTNTYTVNSVPARIRYTGAHPLKHFEVQSTASTHTTYLRGRKLVGSSLEAGHALVITREFDTIRTHGEVSATRWFEREGVKTDILEKLTEMQRVADVIHG